jgi:curved DNA-binding protein CbpA
MTQSQEAQSFDPYKTLELHPQAPRDLVVAAYWALVARAKQRRTGSGAAGGSLDELNAAYRLLADEAARAAYDAQHRVTESRGSRVRSTGKGLGVLGFFGKARLVSDHDDFYHLLCVDRLAGADVIDAAFAVMSGQAVGRDAEDVFLRGLLEEARHTLRNPQLRAQYDASHGTGSPKAPPPQAAAPAPAPLPATYNLQPTTYANGNGRHAALPVFSPEDQRAEAAATRASATSEVPEPAEAIARAAESPQPAASQVLPAMYAKSGEAGGPAIPTETPAPGAPAAADGVAPSTSTEPAADAARGLLGRLRMPPRASRGSTTYNPQPTTSQIIDAEHARLLTLREDQPSPITTHQSPVTNHQSPAAVILAELVFLEGPRAGERVPLGADAVNLGSSYSSHVVLAGDAEHIAPEHARIWRHGDHFVFRQLDDGETTIAGQPLTLPMVVLDDGDEIRISVHRMRLEERT